MRLFLIRLAFKNIFRRRLRAFLTIGGVALSSAIMVLLFGLGSGMQKMVTAQISKTSLRNVITVNSKNVKDLRLDQARIAKIGSVSGVASVEQVANISGQVTRNGISLIIPTYGVSEHFFESSPATTTAGKAEDVSGEGHVIMLSEAALKALGGDKALLNSKVSLRTTITQDTSTTLKELSKDASADDFKIVAVADTGNRPVAYIPIGYLAKQGVDITSEAKVMVSYNDKVPTVREAIEQMGFQTTNIQDSIDQVNRIFKVIRSILAAFAFIAVLITIFGTVNTITIELVEATKQIGFLRIIGIKKAEVGRLFIMQSVILGLSGVVVGIIGGLLLGMILNGALMGMAVQGSISGSGSALYVYQIPAVPIIIMLMLAVGLGWLIGLLPAKRAVHLNPLTALKS